MKINKKYKSLKRRKIEKLVKRNSALPRIEREVVLKNYGHYVLWLLGGFIQLQLSDCLYISLFTPDSQFSSQWSPSKIFNINHKISHVAGVLHSRGEPICLAAKWLEQNQPDVRQGGQVADQIHVCYPTVIDQATLFRKEKEKPV